MKSRILASGLNVSKEDMFLSPKQKILYKKPDKFKNLKNAVKRKVINEIPEVDQEDEDESDFICDEGVKAAVTDRDVVGASVAKSRESTSSFSDSQYRSRQSSIINPSFELFGGD